MATSGSFYDYGYANTSSTNGIGLYCSWSATQSVANNTSTVTVKVYVNSYSLTCSSKTLTIKAFGQTKTVSTNAVSDTDGTLNKQLLGSATFTVTHNANGSMSGTISLSWACNVSIKNGATFTISTMTASDSVTLTTIPRASSINSLTGTALGSSVSVAISRASSSFTHKVEYKIGSSSYVTANSSAGTSASFTPDVSYASQNTTGTSVTCTVRVTTYNGSTQIGDSVTKSITLSIPSSVVPSISSISLSDYNGHYSTFGGYVQNKSRLSVTVNASGIHGSSISSYKTTVQGVSYTSKSFTSGVLTTSGTLTITSTVTDSRGRSASKSVSITVYEYFTPKITKFTVQRCTSDGTVDDNGTYLKCTYSYQIASVNSKNTRSVKIQYLNDSTWTNLATVTTEDYSKTNATYTSTKVFDADTSYSLRLYVADYFTSVTNDQKLQTVFTLMNYGANGTSIGFGKVAEKDKAIEFGIDIYDKNGNKIDVGDLQRQIDELKALING